MGLCNRLAETGRGLESTLALVKQLRRASPAALRAVKTLLKKCDGQDQAYGMDVENELFGAVWDGEHHREAQAAFLENVFRILRTLHQRRRRNRR